LIKNKVQAFSLKRVEDHQFESLRLIKQNGGHVAVILGCWIPKKDYWFMVFDADLIYERRETSIKQKELFSLCEKGYNISLRNKDFNMFKPELLMDRMVKSLPGDDCGSLY
jgi:penicillin-binding protein-related factor A (putative recombinase)